MANPRNQDRFRHVPEPLFSIILSYLPFKEAARTSVLSKQWRNIWYSTRNIELHERFFVRPEHSDEEKQERRLAFLNFIQQWIQMHDERCANRFCLSLSDPKPHKEVMDKAINFALSRKVKVLEIDFSEPSWLMDGLFRSGSHQLLFCSIKHEIEGLKLTSVDLMLKSSSKTYASLKNLSLACANMPGERLNKILALCPSLEYLSLHKCREMGFLMLTNMPSLKRLSIVVCDLDFTAGILLDAPSLHFFQYRGFSTPIVGQNLKTLNVAVLDFGIETEVNFARAELLYNILRELCYIRALSVCSYMLQGIQIANEPLLLEPRLENVKILRFRGTELNEKEYHGITFFLNSCPNLEALIIDIRVRGIFHDNEPPYKMEEHAFMTKEGFIIACECVRKTLKSIKVTGYTGVTCEERVLKYLLKYGYVLENVEIHLVPNNWQFYRQRAQPLLDFPKASPNVNISIL